MNLYIESSAVGKLIVQERETGALKMHLNARAAGGDVIFASALVETEMRRFARRRGNIDQAFITDVLKRFSVAEISRSIYTEAGLLPGKYLRSLNALHITVALRVQADAFISYDARQCEAAHEVGLETLSPQ